MVADVACQQRNNRYFARINAVRFAAIVFVLLWSISARADLIFDGGDPQRAGAVVREGSSVTAIAAIFAVENDSMATSFGIAASRAMGPQNTGFTAYLMQNMTCRPDMAIESWEIVPSSTQFTYYFHQTQTPIQLKANVGYAVVLVPSTSDFVGGVSYSNSAGYYGWASPDQGASWLIQPRPFCVRVEGYAVPEPASACVLIAGLMSICATVRKRR